MEASAIKFNQVFLCEICVTGFPVWTKHVTRVADRMHPSTFLSTYNRNDVGLIVVDGDTKIKMGTKSEIRESYVPAQTSWVECFPHPSPGPLIVKKKMTGVNLINVVPRK